jgi:murein DD-endopeptidase MepM/ murein hydrolase activator NlpD
MQQKGLGPLAFALAPVVLIASFFGILILLSGGGAAAACTPGSNGSTVDVSKVPQGPIAGFDHDQLVAAANIMNAAQQLGLNGRAQQIGVMTAIGESTLRPLNYGDGAINPDGSVATSIGFFQQQDSWGTREQRLDAFQSATLFFERLPGIEGWETMEPTLVANAIQGNADPYFYVPFWEPAGVIATALTGNAPAAPTVPGSTTAPSTAAPSAGGCASGGAVAFPLTKPFNMTDNFGPRVVPVEGASSYHPAVDLSGACGTPVYSIGTGTVTLSDRLTLSVKTPDGYTVSYLHSNISDRKVNVGDTVTMGQEITAIGDQEPSSGCHLDVRINVTGNTNAQVATLPLDPEAPGWVDPEPFYALFGLTLCDDTCQRIYTD